MGYLSHRVDPSEIKAGDHIYTWRTAFTYAHHGIYVGGNKVVHFTTGEKDSSDFSSSNQNLQNPCSNCLDCGFRQPGSSVVLSCLNCFITNGSLYLFQYETNPYEYISKLRAGTCTIAKSDPHEEVVHRAMYLLQNGFGEYDVVLNNCEDFALYCKTGLLSRPVFGKCGSSGQVKSWGNALWTVIVPSTLKRFVCSSPAAAVVSAAGVHCWNRFVTDIGVRDDVVKVKVEDIASFRGN